ncbi:GPW/gp25 family protein [Pandoraea sp. ISTKB]|uniref:GPW/gp25 family protein n=1 Tax=Pandoraea sp. ISTKB TaxID=1586708 RepID=UPI000846973D|nr:GPW/gp25 family protein [Pandoraea sp. ISTKB]ODP33073.1 phage baseplate protein [Pandoraea sp. ISTKB]
MTVASELVGMDRVTGMPLRGIAHVKQSIGDILSTRKGARRERPEYGSNIPLMVDLPLTRGLISEMQADAAQALGRWEPRIKLERVVLVSLVGGKPTFRIEGEYEGNREVFEVLL